MARRQYDYHSTCPEAGHLLTLLGEFDRLIDRYHAPEEAAGPCHHPPPVLDPGMETMFATSRGLLLHWLDLMEDQLFRLGWWDPEPDEPRVAYARWMRETFVPGARASLRSGIVPQVEPLGSEAARRLEVEGLALPPDHAAILANFTEGAASYHETWRLCGLPPAVPVEDAPFIPPAFSVKSGQEVPHPALPDGPPGDTGFEVILADARNRMSRILDRVESALGKLPDIPARPAGGAVPVEIWLEEDFLPPVRAWLGKDEVPRASLLAPAAAEEFRARGVEPPAELLEALGSFDSGVLAYHQLQAALPGDTAGARLAAAWRLLMTTPVLNAPAAPEPDALRLQMLLILNRMEAELHLLGWWCREPAPMPPGFQGTIEYPARRDGEGERPRFEPWIQASFLPEMRARVQTASIPVSSRARDSANRALASELLGPGKFQESRRLYRCFDELETLMLRAWPAAVERQREAFRLRGLLPPSRLSPERQTADAAEIAALKAEVAEALRMVVYELRKLGWWHAASPDRVPAAMPAPGESPGPPPPFEHWLREDFFPETRAALREDRVLQERRTGDYVAWECRHAGLTENTRELLARLERLDHCCHLYNRTRREHGDEPG